MNHLKRKTISRLVKLIVCGAAFWYLAAHVTLNDYIRLADNPQRRYRLVSESPETLHIQDPATCQERDVARSALATERSGVHPIERGIRFVVGTMDLRWAALGLLVVGPVTFLIAWRLRWLLAIQKIHVPYRDAVLLTFAGNFFNFSMPGTTMGDVYKAYHLAQQTTERTAAVTVILLDRIVGLVSFLLLAVGAVIASTGRQLVGDFSIWVAYLGLAFLLACTLFFSSKVRTLIRFDAILTRLPFAGTLRRVDETVFRLREHPFQAAVALGVSIVCHFLMITSMFLIARSIGMQDRPGHGTGDLYLAMIVAVIVGCLFAAIPISYQGFGVLEAVFIRVLVQGGWSSMSQMLALTLAMRMVQIIWSLPGVVVPWLGFGSPNELADQTKLCSPGRP